MPLGVVEAVEQIKRLPSPHVFLPASPLKDHSPRGNQQGSADKRSTDAIDLSKD